MEATRIIEYRRERNKLSRKRMKAAKDTAEHKSLTTRIENIDEYIRIAKTEYTAQGS